MDELAYATKGLVCGPIGDSREEHSSIQYRIETDTRVIATSPHDSPIAFWALRGETHDGHAFAQAAIDAGARALVLEENSNFDACSYGLPFIKVHDTSKALQQLAGWHRSRQDVHVVGVTGSFGKTTTRGLIAAVLNAKIPTFQSPRNFNNHFGVPLSLLSLTAEHVAAVLEFGASSRGEISPLAQMAAPSIAVITGIGRAHVARFGSIRNTIEAKRELAEVIPEDGLVILPGDDPHCNDLAWNLPCQNVVRVGFVSPQNHVNADWKLDSAGLTIKFDNATFNLDSRAEHFRFAMLQAVIVGKNLGLSNTEIQEGLRAFRPAEGRCKFVQLGSWIVIDDTYNASPEASIAACRLLGQQKGPRVLVFGDMLELGDSAAEAHQELAVAAVENQIDYVLAIGSYADSIRNTCCECGMPEEKVLGTTSFEELLSRVLTLTSSLPGGAILVKGSRRLKMERVVAAVSTSWQGRVEDSQSESPQAVRDCVPGVR